jgi:hypothetical protein
MNKDEIKASIVLAAVFALGALCGFFIGKGIYQPTYDEKVAMDTVIVHDTVFDYQPAPVDSARVRYVTRFLPVVKNDTINHFVEVSKMIHDTVEVQVPITSKHYVSKDYDAWVSGYEPSLDSIKVYKETQYITETITKTVKDKGKHFFLDVGAGCEYQFNTKSAVPFAELGARVKLGRFGIGAYGGYSHDTKENKGLPYAKAKVTYDIIWF